MTLQLLLVIVPLASGLIIVCIPSFKIRKPVVLLSIVVSAGLSVATAVMAFSSMPYRAKLNMEWLDPLLFILELGLCAFVAILSLRRKRILPALLALVQAGIAVYYEEACSWKVSVNADIVIDQLSAVMILIVGVIGGLILLYATGYMRIYHEDHKAVPDRRRLFFFLVFAFLSAMFGLVISNDIQKTRFFWEITTVVSFLLIGYSKDDEARRNAFRALNINLAGGIAFALGCVALADRAGVMEFSRLLPEWSAALTLPIALFAIAASVKSAMLPFSPWLLGAMVAPTPVSALLHSATMVKAGTYLVIRLAPLLEKTMVGYLLAFVGAASFLVGAFAAISSRNAKRLLAWSTISNLGLIVASAAIGSYQLAWVAIFLMIFHAAAKSLMFLTVGSTAIGTGSLDIESMTGLIIKMPRVAAMMLAGMAGMFVAPFGMLVAKWAAMEAFINMHNAASPFMILAIAFGSAATVFYWAKWMGTIIRERDPHSRRGLSELLLSKEEFVAMAVLSAVVLVVCLVFPLISSFAVEPWLLATYGVAFGLGTDNVMITIMMVAILVGAPVILAMVPKLRRIELGGAYMSGRPSTEDLRFSGSAGKEKNVVVHNYYLARWFDEKRLLWGGAAVSAILLMALLGMAVL